MWAVQDNQPLTIRPISTGSIKLDLALGTGGLPHGQIAEISGSSGKTTLCLHIVSEAQANGEMCAWINADPSFNPAYAMACGVQPEQLYYSQTTIAEQALDILEILARSAAFGVIVLDSLTSLVSQAEKTSPFTGAASDQVLVLLSNSIPRLKNTIQKNQTLILFTRSSLPRGSRVYHHLAQNPARLALGLAASVRLELSPLEIACAESPNERIAVIVRKNSFSPCIDSTELDIIVNRGLNINGEIIDLGLQVELIRQQGDYYYYHDLLLGSSRDQVSQILQNNIRLRNELAGLIRQKKLPAAATSS